MKRFLFIFISAFSAVGLFAQETYENANIATGDLNGTARYVGMGGAMDALGADISTIATNPAGIGLFRHSAANVSFGFVSQQDAKDFAGANATNMSFDQIGFVYSRRTGRSSFLNFAFNYHKSRNFNYILSAADALNGASQNKYSYMKGVSGVFGRDDSGAPSVDYGSLAFSQLDYLYYENILPVFDEEGEYVSDVYNDANGYMFNRASSGYIGEYDFNISGNIDDRLYLGLTVGIHDVNYNGYSEYSENLVSSEGTPVGSVAIGDERIISGTGFNIKFGMIFRPIENSPFRIGISASTPTWYDLSTRNHTVLANNTELGEYDSGTSDEAYDFKLYTPWKFGLSLGTTFGNYLAVGASYDYANYGNLDTRINDGGGYDWYYGDYYEGSSSDKAMNSHTDRTLKGVSTLKVGLEFKPDAALAIRLGYNYVSPMYNKNGYKDYTVDSPGTYYTSSTDYTNWKATNRITCGLGYSVKKFSFDVAYQYSVQNGDFHPFTDFGSAAMPDGERNLASSTDVSNKRHQVLFTMGYAF